MDNGSLAPNPPAGNPRALVVAALCIRWRGAQNGAMTTPTAVDGADQSRSQCWCCGATDASARMVHLGNHPEVALCTRCARWAARQARDLEDLSASGVGVLVRDRLRAARRVVMDRGWHQQRFVGGPLRWLGKHLP